ncbi:MAG: PAS domain-containing protein [Ferrovibrio sp.]
MVGPAHELRDVQWAILESAGQLSHPLLRRLHADWLAAMSGDGLPGHDFVDPVRLKYLLGALLVVGVERDDGGAMRFHYRLIGTDLVARAGRDATGLWMHEHPDAEVARTGPPACQHCVESGKAVRIMARRVIFDKSYPLEYLLVPLVNDDDLVDRLVIAQLYPPDAPRLPYGS